MPTPTPSSSHPLENHGALPTQPSTCTSTQTGCFERLLESMLAEASNQISTTNESSYILRFTVLLRSLQFITDESGRCGLFHSNGNIFEYSSAYARIATRIVRYGTTVVNIQRQDSTDAFRNKLVDTREFRVCISRVMWYWVHPSCQSVVVLREAFAHPSFNQLFALRDLLATEFPTMDFKTPLGKLCQLLESLCAILDKLRKDSETADSVRTVFQEVTWFSIMFSSASAELERLDCLRLDTRLPEQASREELLLHPAPPSKTSGNSSSTSRCNSYAPAIPQQPTPTGTVQPPRTSRTASKRGRGIQNPETPVLSSQGSGDAQTAPTVSPGPASGIEDHDSSSSRKPLFPDQSQDQLQVAGALEKKAASFVLGLILRYNVEQGANEQAFYEWIIAESAKAGWTFSLWLITWVFKRNQAVLCRKIPKFKSIFLRSTELVPLAESSNGTVVTGNPDAPPAIPEVLLAPPNVTEQSKRHATVDATEISAPTAAVDELPRVASEGTPIQEVHETALPDQLNVTEPSSNIKQSSSGRVRKRKADSSKSSNRRKKSQRPARGPSSSELSACHASIAPQEPILVEVAATESETPVSDTATRSPVCTSGSKDPSPAPRVTQRLHDDPHRRSKASGPQGLARRPMNEGTRGRSLVVSRALQGLTDDLVVTPFLEDDTPQVDVPSDSDTTCTPIRTWTEVARKTRPISERERDRRGPWSSLDPAKRTIIISSAGRNSRGIIIPRYRGLETFPFLGEYRSCPELDASNPFVVEKAITEVLCFHTPATKHRGSSYIFMIDAVFPRYLTSLLKVEDDYDIGHRFVRPLIIDLANWVFHRGRSHHHERKAAETLHYMILMIAISDKPELKRGIMADERVAKTLGPKFEFLQRESRGVHSTDIAEVGKKVARFWRPIEQLEWFGLDPVGAD